MKTQNPLIGRSKKSFGEATFYTLNGQNIVRTKAISVANPKSEKQQAQRARFIGITKLANSVNENDLSMLFPVKAPRQNRRSTLQQQLAVAFDAEVDTTAPTYGNYVATFNADKLDTIGTGEVGFIGDLATVSIESDQFVMTESVVSSLRSGMQGVNNTDEVLLVVISEDGCILKVVDTGLTFENFVVEGDEQEITIADATQFKEHGNSAFCYAIGGKLQLIGLGTFSVAERPARKGHDPRHSKGVTPNT